MTRSSRSRWVMAAAGISSLALVLSGCSSDSDEAAEGGGTTGASDCAAFYIFRH